MPTVDEPNKPGDRVWDQIEEILEKDERRDEGPIRIARPVAPRKVRAGTPVWYPTAEKLIAAGILLMVIAVILRQYVLPLTLAGFVLAGIGYYYLVMRKRRARWGASGNGPGGSPTKYWRGRPVEPSSPPKRRDGNILEFPDTARDKARRRFGRKK